MEKVKRNQKIPVSKLDNILEELGDLTRKEKSELNLRESIYYLRYKLKRALKQGYSYEDLTKILAEQNIVISANTLKQYLSQIFKKSSQKRQQTNSIQLESAQEVTQNKISTNKKIKKADIKKSTAKIKTVTPSSETKEVVDISEKSNYSKLKSAILSGSDQDLSHEFNQY